MIVEGLQLEEGGREGHGFHSWGFCFTPTHAWFVLEPTACAMISSNRLSNRIPFWYVKISKYWFSYQSWVIQIFHQFTQSPSDDHSWCSCEEFWVDRIGTYIHWLYLCEFVFFSTWELPLLSQALHRPLVPRGWSSTSCRVEAWPKYV